MVAAGLSLAFAVFVSFQSASYLTRLGGDFLTPLAVHFYQPQKDNVEPGVAVVVIDEITHKTSPFSETPEVAWTPYLGEVMAAINDADAAVVGLDMIFPKSIAGRDLAPGYDRSFLKNLAVMRKEEKIVLAEVRLSQTPIKPYRGQEIAVGGASNIRPVHLTPDSDNVVRRHPAWLALEDGGRVRSFAGELSARAGVSYDDDILINYITPTQQFPTYRFSDLYECMKNSDKEAFNVFKGKAVLIGTALDIEDRHLGGNRLQRHKDPEIAPPPCGNEANQQTASIYRASTPGVFIEARAVNTFLTKSGLKTLSPVLVFVITLTLLLVLSYAYLNMSPIFGVVVFTAYGILVWLVGAFALAGGVLAPAMPWVLSGFALYIIIYGYRVIIEDQSKRWVTHAFQHYLAPALVKQLADEPDALRLSGERRRVAVLFADLEGFTTASEQLAEEPEALVEHLNNFFEIMTGCIEVRGGYVDKFIGDAVMGVWGAPVNADAPEAAAVQAARASMAAVDEYNKNLEGAPLIKMRIGISAGEVIAGNLGSKDRFNYTVIGDAVNRAARLEQENKRLNTRVLMDGSIADQLSDDVLVDLVDEAVLRGQSKAAKLYTLKE